MISWFSQVFKVPTSLNQPKDTGVSSNGSSNWQWKAWHHVSDIHSHMHWNNVQNLVGDFHCWWTYHQGFGPFADDFPFNGLSLSHACMTMLHQTFGNIYEPTWPCISWRQIQGMNQGMATPLTCISSFLFWSSPECKLQTLEPNPNRTSWLNRLIAKTNEHINPCIPVSMSWHMGKWIHRHAYYIDVYCILYNVSI